MGTGHGGGQSPLCVADLSLCRTNQVFHLWWVRLKGLQSKECTGKKIPNTHLSHLARSQLPLEHHVLSSPAWT